MKYGVAVTGWSGALEGRTDTSRTGLSKGMAAPWIKTAGKTSMDEGILLGVRAEI